MKKTVLIIMTMIILSPLASKAMELDNLLLYRKVEYRDRDCANCGWKKFQEFTTPISKNVYAIQITFAYKVRAEILWLTKFRPLVDGLIVNISHEKNDYPMDETWDIIWTLNNHHLVLERPFVHKGRIRDKDYRMTLIVLEKSDNNRRN